MSNFNAITDRTIGDVNRVKELVEKGFANMTNDELTEFQGYMKGRLVASDLNRIDDFVNEINFILSAQSIATLPTLPTDFVDGDIISSSYIEDLQTCLDYIAQKTGLDGVSLVNLDYTKLNSLESLLHELDTRLEIDNTTGNTYTNDLPLQTNISIYTHLPSLPPYTTQVKKVTVYGGFSSVYCSFNPNHNPSTPFTNLEEIDLTHIYSDKYDQVVNSYNFYSLEALRKITLPPCVVRLWDFAFGYCRKLEQINIPKSVQYIYKNVFIGCDKLNTLKYEGTMAEWNAMTYKDANWKTGSSITSVVCTDGTISV